MFQFCLYFCWTIACSNPLCGMHKSGENLRRKNIHAGMPPQPSNTGSPPRCQNTQRLRTRDAGFLVIFPVVHGYLPDGFFFTAFLRATRRCGRPSPMCSSWFASAKALCRRMYAKTINLWWSGLIPTIMVVTMSFCRFHSRWSMIKKAISFRASASKRVGWDCQVLVNCSVFAFTFVMTLFMLSGSSSTCFT